MKILQINKFFYLKGGSEAYLFSLINGLKKHGIEIAEFAMQDSRNHESIYQKFFVSPIDYETDKTYQKIKFVSKIIYSFEAKKKIAMLLNKFKPDIVHLHIFQHQISPSILPEIKKRHIPIIYTAHDLKTICPNYKMLSHGNVCEECKGHKYYKCVKNKCVKNSYLKSIINSIEMYFHHWRKYYELIDLIITPSDFYRKKLIEFKFPADRVIHIPNFVDDKLFRQSYYNDGYFIYLGRLSEEKGLLTLIKAMRTLKDAKLKIIGTGPLEDEIKKSISSLRLTNIELVGFQSGAALEKYISNAMFTIIPSEWYENGSISLLESFAYGKPVIGSNIGGIPEHISHGRNGLIFKTKDPADLAEKINILVNDSQRLKTMLKASQRQ